MLVVKALIPVVLDRLDAPSANLDTFLLLSVRVNLVMHVGQGNSQPRVIHPSLYVPRCTICKCVHHVLWGIIVMALPIANVCHVLLD